MDHIFECKHCKELFTINSKDFNCMILRHGVLKSTMNPINPHSPKNECDDLVSKKLIYGCGKPLQIINNNNQFDVIICDYI